MRDYTSCEVQPRRHENTKIFSQKNSSWSWRVVVGRLEPDLEDRVVSEAAEIDLVAGEELIGRQFALRRLPADLAAGSKRTALEDHAAHDYRSGGRAARFVRVAADAAVAEIDPLTRFAVAPSEDADAGADVRLHW